MYNAVEIANYFVKKSIDTGESLTPMKLIKLTYISHGWYLALYDRPLINEAVQAWTYGPVIDSIYQAFKKYGGEQIISLTEQGFERLESNPDIIRFLDKMWELYSSYDGLELSALTHKINTPWSRAIEKGNSFIPNDSIKSHYKEKLRPANAS